VELVVAHLAVTRGVRRPIRRSSCGRSDPLLRSMEVFSVLQSSSIAQEVWLTKRALPLTPSAEEEARGRWPSGSSDLLVAGDGPPGYAGLLVVGKRIGLL
jgi:hypothetical protein